MEICEILANFTADSINASCASAEETQMSAWGNERHQTQSTKVKQEKADEDETQEYQYQQQQQQHQHHQQHHHHEMINEVKLESEELTAGSQHPSYFHSFASGSATGAAGVLSTTFDSDCASTPASSASFDSDLAASTSFASHQLQQQQQHRTDPATPPFKYEQHHHHQISSSVSRILNGKFFKIAREDGGDNITAVCLKCLPQVVEIKGNKKTSSNFVSHLKRRHGQETLDEYERWKRQRRDDGGRPTHSQLSYYNRKHPELGGCGTAYPQHQQQAQLQHQQNQQNQQQQLQQQQQQNFNECLVQYVINSLVPLREVENAYFKQLFQPLASPGLTVPTCRQLTEEIEKRFDWHISVVTERIQAAKYICATADLLWCASERCSILGVTAHWLNADDNLQRQSAALACRRFEQRNRKKASPLTPALLQEILQKYGINQTKLVATITGNRRNYVQAFKIFGVDTAVLMSAAEYAQEKAAIKSEATTRTEEFVEDSDNDNNNDDDDDDDDDVSAADDNDNNDVDDDDESSQPADTAAWQAALPNLLSGSNHALIVCLQGAFEESLRMHSALAQLHAQVIAKCNTIWKLLKNSRNARRKLNSLLLVGGGDGGVQILVRPVETRWNSLSHSLKQLWTARDKMPAAAKALKIDNPLTTLDFAYILEYLRCTEPVTRALEVLQDDDEENSYYGIVLPCILSLKHKLEALRNQSWLYCAPLIVTLCDTVAKRFHELTGFESLQSKKAVIASITLPRFKNRWFSLVAPSLHAHLMDILKTEAALEQNSVAAGNSQAEEPANVSYKNDDFFDFLTERSEPSANSLVNTCELEVLKYLSDPDTRLNCLDNYPILRKLFIKFNTTLPSSTPAESLLPYASMIEMPPRSKRSSYDDMFEKRIILKSKLSNCNKTNACKTESVCG